MTIPANRKPPLAAWIQRQRKLKGWKPQDVADRLSAMNLPVTADTVKVWESNANRRPSPYNLEGLEQLFESPSPVAETAPEPGSVPAAYLERIDALVGELAADRALISRLVGAIERLVQTPEEREAMRQAAAAFEADSTPSPREPAPESSAAGSRAGPGRTSSTAPALSGRRGP